MGGERGEEYGKEGRRTGVRGVYRGRGGEVVGRKKEKREG
jgi:hypothetical protein